MHEHFVAIHSWLYTVRSTFYKHPPPPHTHTCTHIYTHIHIDRVKALLICVMALTVGRWTLRRHNHYKAATVVQNCCSSFAIVSISDTIDGSNLAAYNVCSSFHHHTAVTSLFLNVAVPNRNQILFRRIFQAHHRVWCAIALNFHWGRGSCALHKCIRYLCIYTSCMSPALSRSSPQ